MKVNDVLSTIEIIWDNFVFLIIIYLKNLLMLKKKVFYWILFETNQTIIFVEKSTMS